MESSSRSGDESPVFQKLHDVVRQDCPSPLYERDLFLNMINNKKLRARARTFSRDVMGGDGQIHLTNHDYRLLLGVLSSSFVLLKDKKNTPTGVLMSALETFEQGCRPGADALSARVQALLEYEHDDIRCSVRRRVRDIIRLLEVSYPLGTSITDPDGGPELLIPADRHISMFSFVDEVEENIRLHPVRKSKTEILSTNQMKQSIMSVRTELEEGGIARAGADEYYTTFFGIRSEAQLVLQSEIDLGSTCNPGRFVIVRQAGKIAVMMKNVLCYSSQRSAEDDPVSDTGDVAVKTKPAQSKDQHIPVSTLSVSRRGPTGGFDTEHPDVQYDFFDVSDEKLMTAFGKTVRTARKERSSAQ